MRKAQEVLHQSDRAYYNKHRLDRDDGAVKEAIDVGNNTILAVYFA